MPETASLSLDALKLMRMHVEQQGRIELDDSNRGAYQELEAAGLMLLSRPFAGPRVYRLTRAGYEFSRPGGQLNPGSP